jgi:hypothetical protein
MKVKYQNENLRAKAGEHLSFIKFFSILLIFGITILIVDFIITLKRRFVQCEKHIDFYSLNL